MGEPDRRSEDAAFYQWALSRGKPFANGGVQALADRFQQEPDRATWGGIAEKLMPWLAGLLQRFEEMSLPLAYQTAGQILLAARCEAEDRAEAVAEQQRHHVAVLKPVPKATTQGPVVEKFSAVAQRVVKEAEEPVEAIATPFPGLNRMLHGGFRLGELTYLGGRPGTGKSAFAVEVATHIAQRGVRSLIVSREMKNVALGRRMIAQHGRMNAGNLRLGRNIDWNRLAAEVQRMHDYPIWLTEAAYTVPDIERCMEAIGEVRFVVVDYLHLLTAPKHIQDRRLQVEAISKGLKELTLRCNVALLAVASLSRPQGRGEDTPPTLASLRESGNLEHDADNVILLHRQGDARETQCLIAKSREGPIGLLKLLFRAESVVFDEAETHYDQDDERRCGDDD